MTTSRPVTPTPTPRDGAALSAVPQTRGGWWHAYVCPTHGVELDPAVPARPGYRCRYGCVLTGEPYESAWVALDHQRTARRIRLLAAQAGPDGVAAAAADEAIALVEQYAAVYDRLAATPHSGAADWMVPGRVFQQALSECIWAVGLADAVWTLTERVDGDRVARLTEAAVPMLMALHDTAAAARGRVELRSNYVAWFDAAGAMCSGTLRRLGVAPADRGWVDGPAGIHAHLRAAVGDDGWQWEGSTYYHAFVLLAALYAMRGTDPAALPEDVVRRVRGMVEVLDGIAGSDGVLPALHDSPYRRPAAAEDLQTEHQVTEVTELAEVVGLSRALFGPAVLDRLGAWCGQVLSDRDEAAMLGRWANWFAGPPLDDVSTPVDTGPDVPGPITVFPDVGYAVLRPSDGVWQAVLDAGPHGGSHGHLDKLALYVTGAGVAWQPDLGITPYASPLRTDVYRTTRAHPAFSVDGADQAESAGVLVHRSADGTTIVGAADDAFPGVQARRHLRLLDDRTLLDVVDLRADRECDLTVHLRPAVPVDVHGDDTGGQITWSGPTALTTRHVCSVPARLAVVPGWSPADDPTRHQAWIDWTATARRAVFATVWQFAGDRDAAAEAPTAEVVVGPDAVEVRRAGLSPIVHPLTLHSPTPYPSTPGDQP